MNGLMPHTTTSTELQRNYQKVAKRAKALKEPIVVLSNNKPEGVYMDYEVFKSLQKRPKEIKKKKEGFEKFLGLWTKEEADAFDKVIEEEFERIDPEDWK